MSKNIYHYYVEGKDEEKLINVLKREFGCICSGRVNTFNMIQNEFTSARIRTLKEGTIVVLVYDTDVETNLNTLETNIEYLKKQKAVKSVLCIPQVKNLDDELEYACNVKCVNEITNSPTKSEYKHDLIKCTNLDARLKKCKFDINLFWSRLPKNKFEKFGNDAEKIKKK